MTESAERALVHLLPRQLSSRMNTTIMSAGAQPFVQLQQEIHGALREQHPEWVQPNGDCPTCESYESRFAELLGKFAANERQSAA